MPESEFVDAATPFLSGGEPAIEALQAMAPLVQERVKTLAEVDGMIEFLWLDEPNIDESAWDKHLVRGAAGVAMVTASYDRLEAIDEAGWCASAIEEAIMDATVSLGFVNEEGRPRLAKTQGPVRVAITGRAVGPPLWESLTFLGRERTLARLDAARHRVM